MDDPSVRRGGLKHPSYPLQALKALLGSMVHFWMHGREEKGLRRLKMMPLL
jgi:hypothetical protein